MLTEYTVDTKDETLFPSSIELRKRFAGRKLDKAIEAGHVSAETLVTMKDLNRKERQEHMHESFTISMSGVTGKIAVSRAEQQLDIEGKLRMLDRDINRASRLGKSRIDTLSDLEKRIHAMRYQLKDTTPVTVEQQVGTELASKNKVKAEKNFTQCARCQRRILIALYATHHEVCSKLNGDWNMLREDIYDVNVNHVVATATFVPQPPRNCAVKSKGHTFIEWQWEPPVTDGGLAVTEYEMSYTIRRMEMDHSTGKYVKTVEFCPSWKTSMWAMLNPVCHHGYKMVGLRAGAEYSDFKIRCGNLRGWSEWVDMIGHDAVKLDDPIAPSPPLFVRSPKITSSCMYLEWDPPYFDGGQDLIEYKIFYTVLERHISATSRNVIVAKDRTLKVGTALSAVVRNIPAETKVVNIGVKVTNKSLLTSEIGFLDYNPSIEVETKECSRNTLLVRAMNEALASKAQYMDSDILQGVQQRLPRKYFIRQLQSELLKTPVDEEELMEVEVWKEIMAIEEEERQRKEAERIRKEKIESGEIEDDDEAEDEANKAEVDYGRMDDLSIVSLFSSQGSAADIQAMDKEELAAKARLLRTFIFTHSQRRMHFRRKMKQLEKKIVALKKERYDIDRNRAMLTSLMKTKQKRQQVLRIERDRLANFQGDMITSSVIHGHEVQCSYEMFMEDVEKEYKKCQAAVANAKSDVIAGENRKVAVKIELDETEMFLKERNAAFLEFEVRANKSMRAVERFTHFGVKSDETIKTNYFAMWHTYIEERKALRKNVLKAFKNLINRFKRNAFTKWHSGHFYSPESAGGGFFGVGSQMLQEAREKRTQLQGLLREAIAGTTSLRHKINMVEMTRDNRNKLVKSDVFKSQEQGLDHQGLAESAGMHFLYEADGYTTAGKFEMAKNLYEAQVMYLRAAAPQINIKLLSICHGRLGRMFMLQGKYDRGIVEFDRQLSLAREIDDKPEAADAYFGIGYGYMKRYSYDYAIEYLDKAQSRLAALSNIPKYSVALRALRDCYDRLDKPDTVKMYNETLDKLEGELRDKVKLIDTRLDDYRLRLRRTSADIELIVKIERTTLKALELRNFIHRRTDEAKDLEEERDKQIEAREKVEKILEAIQKELNEAFSTDELEMWSSLVHDKPQMIDVEELKTRLAARRVRELDNYIREKEGEKTLIAKVKNAYDDLERADDDLALENGALAKHVRHDKPFRCIAFCAANAAGNEVTGTASGGVENFIAAEGFNTHVIDYHNGELLYVFIGDSKETIGAKKGHVGVVTCLLHDATYIFSGSADETIICWHATSKSMLHQMKGHEGSVVSLAASGPMLASGAADSTIRLWDKALGTQLRVVYGHSKSIMSMEMGPTWLLTGSTDEEVRVWDIAKKFKHTTTVDCKYRLIGHEVPVTCVRYGQLEVLSGDSLGRVFIWWMQTGEILKKIQVHQGPVKCMQFDAIHIVTGGTDCTVAITDVATGEPLQSLRGHDGHVLAVAFDDERIISAGGDNTVRYWAWGKQSGRENKLHVLNKGETLVAVCKQYGIKVEEIMAWNGIKDIKDTYIGMKLIVRKGDPDQLTKAEQAALEEKRKLEMGMSLTAQKLKKLAAQRTSTTIKYNRLERQATDEDFHSLGNRMFSEDKRANELFPDAFDPDNDTYSLANRLKKNGETNTKVSALRPRYFISEHNEDIWGSVSDALAIAMLGMFCDYAAYEVILELKRSERDKQSVLGRIYAYEDKIDRSQMALEEKIDESLVRAMRSMNPEDRARLRQQQQAERARVMEEKRKQIFEESEKKRVQRQEAEALEFKNSSAVLAEADGAMSDGEETTSRRNSASRFGCFFGSRPNSRAASPMGGSPSASASRATTPQQQRASTPKRPTTPGSPMAWGAAIASKLGLAGVSEEEPGRGSERGSLVPTAAGSGSANVLQVHSADDGETRSPAKLPPIPSAKPGRVGKR